MEREIKRELLDQRNRLVKFSVVGRLRNFLVIEDCG